MNYRRTRQQRLEREARILRYLRTQPQDDADRKLHAELLATVMVEYARLTHQLEALKTYTIDFPETGWIADNIENPGSGRIKLGPARVTIEVELEGHLPPVKTGGLSQS